MIVNPRKNEKSCINFTQFKKGFFVTNFAKKTSEVLESKGLQTEIIDLQKEEVPFCDGRTLQDYPQNVQNIFKKIEEADYAVFGMPVYCFSLSGALKNFIDIFSKAFIGKYFGICSAAGSKLSYLATSDLVKIMHFESSAIGIQPIVLADYTDFENQEISNSEISERIDRMVSALISK